METKDEIKIVLPKRPQGHWLSVEGREEKATLLESYNKLSNEDKVKYNNAVIGNIEVVEDNPELSVSQEETPLSKEDSIPVSQVADIVKKMVEEQLAKATSQAKSEKETSNTSVNQIKNELFDDLPELRDFRAKERIYVLCDGVKNASTGIPTRHKDASPLQYINKESGEVYALFYSDTQTSFFKEKHKGDSKVRHAHMVDGMLKTYETDVKFQKFMRINPHNEAMGGNLFKEYNPSKEAENKIEDFELDLKARNLVVELPFLKQDAIARLLCVDYKEDWTVAEVKKALFQEAIKSPTAFIRLANDKSLEIKGVAKTAIHRGILIYKNYKFFNEKGDVLCEVARNQDEFEAISEYFMSGEGRTTYEFLKNAIG